MTREMHPSYVVDSQSENHPYSTKAAAATPRRRADTETTTEPAPPVKGATEVSGPEPELEGDAAPDAVPNGADVVEAVG